MVDVQARSIESASSKDARFRVSGMGGAPAFCGVARSSLLTLKLSASCAIPQITLISAKGFPKYAKRFMFFHFVSKQVTLAGSRDCAETGLGSFPKKRGTQYRPQNTIILIIGTPKKVPLILGKLHLVSSQEAMKDMPKFIRVKPVEGVLKMRCAVWGA